MKSKGKSWISLNVECLPGKIRIDISNSYQPATNDKGGIGMDNLRKQLSILYPGKHDLQINTANEEFSLTLSLHVSP